MLTLISVLLVALIGCTVYQGYEDRKRFQQDTKVLYDNWDIAKKDAAYHKQRIGELESVISLLRRGQYSPDAVILTCDGLRMLPVGWQEKLAGLESRVIVTHQVQA